MPLPSYSPHFTSHYIINRSTTIIIITNKRIHRFFGFSGIDQSQQLIFDESSKMFNRRLFFGTFPFILILSLFEATNAITGNSLPIHEAISQADEPQAKCTFGVHVKGPDGAEVKDVTLDQELYYKIRCEPVEGYCLRVANCSVSADSDDQKPPYLIIDGRGCTTEPSLFEHVQYEDAFTAGIYNPFPIRFRGQKSAVQFNCVTTLSLLNADGKCQRENCTWNEYSREANDPETTTVTVTEKAKKKKKKVE